MRRLLITIMLLFASAVIAPSYALEANDTMSIWSRASLKERSEFLTKLFGDRQAESVKILRCMDDTSKTPGHTDLQIGDVAKVCASAGNADQPV